ncbi:RluA family pseudouridine synthase [Mycoplasma sp. CSL10137]|uniref:RluA family pseudouridine synthase n=1 Tax=unclassified Mycoplasma TaxID=2683645 RepID=UPI00197BC085|nr:MULTISPECIES: RluA family pseudouridine synthase [unclassified Mycoplasma]MBN4083239.1 RluA family pseudouridine synthase [Mycoplasma sp. CSL10137]MBU4692944.1 RluA family pseudouridine synthase [Mycoplasma sp. CSL7491-lung]MCU4706577.1 RluA family pseudouridine synthase [Mycoplasma sp. CSL7503-lung]
MFEILATKNDSGRTIYKLIAKYLTNLPKSKLESLFRKKDIKINGKRINEKSLIVQENDQIVIYGIFDKKEKKEVFKVEQNFNIIYEDENILIVDKKIGVEVHGPDNSLDNQVLSYLKFKQIDSFKPSHVGRLDKETSGLIIYGKNYHTVKQLNDKISNFDKKYMFKSDFNEQYKEVELYFLKDYSTGKMKVSPKEKENSKYSKTILYVEKNKKIAQILTGRKHQIRLTLKFLGKPIYGDIKYGGKKADRLMLHSYYLKLQNLNGDLKYLNGFEFYSLPKW